MNKSRFDKVGIKQVIRLEWMDRCLSLLLSGMSANEIRKDLIEFLADKKQSGGTGERGAEAAKMAVNMLSVWHNPVDDLRNFRDSLLKQSKRISQGQWITIHWSIMIANYPFWYNMATQVGRILNLQDAVTSQQVYGRITEIYGDRETTLRYARYTMRSFVAWGLLEDSEIKGRYMKRDPVAVSDPQIIALFFEAMLISTPEHKAPLHSLLASPAQFPMCLAMDVAQQSIASNPRLISDHFGDGEIVLSLAQS